MEQISYRYIGRVFLKIGAQAFSGWPMAMLLVEKQLVEKDHTLSRSQLQGAFSYAYFIPGATQVAFVSHVGYKLRGFKGSTLATFCYLLPASSLMLGFAILYFGYLQHMQLAAHMVGLSAALGGVILGNAYRIGKSHASRPWLWGVVIGAFVLKQWFGWSTVVIILVVGLCGAMVSFMPVRKKA